MASQKKSLIIFFFLFLIYSLSVLGFNTLESWSNVGIEWTNDYYSFLYQGSNVPYGSSNFTYSTLANSNFCYPIIYDFNVDGYNEILLTTSTQLKLYSASRRLLSTFTPDNAIKTCPALVNVNNDLDVEISFFTADLLGYNILVVSGYNSTLSLDSTHLIIDLNTLVTPYPTLVGKFQSDAEVCAINIDNDVLCYNFDTETETTINSGVSLGGYTPLTGIQYLGGGASFGDLDRNGCNVFAWLGKASGTTAGQLITWNYCTKTYANKTVSELNENVVYNASVSIANMGNPEGSLEIFTHFYHTTHTTNYYNMYDSGLNMMGWSPQSSDNMFPNYAVADINHDGSMEYCGTDAGVTFRCYNELGTIVVLANLYTPNILGYGFYIAEINDSNNFSEVFGKTAIMGLTNANVTYAVASYTNVVPQATWQSARLDKTTKDMIGYNSAGIYILSLFSNLSIELCGDGNCTINENALTCPTDCAEDVSTNASETIGTLSIGIVCYTNSNCLSGICDSLSHRCIGKDAQAGCVKNEECTSGKCMNGICTSPSVVQYISALVNASGFTDTASLTLFGLFVIVGMFCLGYSFGQTVAGIFFALIGLLIDCVVFAWLGSWFLFTIVFFIIVAITIYALVKFSGGSSTGG